MVYDSIKIVGKKVLCPKCRNWFPLLKTGIAEDTIQGGGVFECPKCYPEQIDVCLSENAAKHLIDAIIQQTPSIG